MSIVKQAWVLAPQETNEEKIKKLKDKIKLSTKLIKVYGESFQLARMELEKVKLEKFKDDLCELENFSPSN